MRDEFSSSLWDIEPYVQVAGICDNDAIILDGARGASIRWKSFYHVSYSTGRSIRRTLALKCMENMTLILVLAIAFFTIGKAYIVLGVILLIIYLCIFFSSPQLIRTVYGGKFHDVQAAFFGFEGYLNASTVERAIFGGAFGRMSWSSNGSPLSLAMVNEHGEKVGVDPTKDPNVRIKVEKAKTALPGEMRVSNHYFRHT